MSGYPIVEHQGKRYMSIEPVLKPGMLIQLTDASKIWFCQDGDILTIKRHRGQGCVDVEESDSIIWPTEYRLLQPLNE